MNPSASNLFTKTALARLASPEQMDQLLTFGSRRSWLVLLALLGVLGAATAWGLLGEVDTRIAGQGMLLRSGGVETVTSMGDGQVAQVLVSTGDHIQAGQTIATLQQPERTDELRAAEAAVSDLERQREHIAGIRIGQNELQEASYAKQRKALQEEVADLRSQADHLHTQQTTEHDLLNKGLITRAQAVQTDQALTATETSMTDKAGQLSQLEAEHFRAANAGTPEELQLSNQIAAAQRNVESLQHSFAIVSAVRSTSTGEVIQVSVRHGDLMRKGTPVLQLQHGGTGLHAVFYAPAEKAKQIQPGMSVELSPSGLKPEEYGFLRGTVERISAFPVTDESLLDALENESLVRTIEAKGAVSEVEIELQPDPSSPGAYRWSSPRGQAVPLSSGTIVSGSVVVREQHPASLVVPYTREKLGLR